MFLTKKKVYSSEFFLPNIILYFKNCSSYSKNTHITKMSTQTRTIERNGKAGKTNVAKSWSKAINKCSVFEDKEELLDIVYWGRQVVGMILGEWCH